jgi:hypothetical protein
LEKAVPIQYVVIDTAVDEGHKARMDRVVLFQNRLWDTAAPRAFPEGLLVGVAYEREGEGKRKAWITFHDVGAIEDRFPLQGGDGTGLKDAELVVTSQAPLDVLRTPKVGLEPFPKAHEVFHLVLLQARLRAFGSLFVDQSRSMAIGAFDTMEFGSNLFVQKLSGLQVREVGVGFHLATDDPFPES